MNHRFTLRIGVYLTLVMSSWDTASWNTVIWAEEFLPIKLDSTHLANAIQVTPQVISGGEPSSSSAFAELKELGIKTIISVDGTQPQVKLAKDQQLRYVHLPHAYSGIPQETALQLAKAVKELPGPIYIHCHHGKHRSPAAAAVACIGAGLIKEQDGTKVLKLAGTSPKYQGLFNSVKESHKLEDELLKSTQAKFPDIADVRPLVDAMAKIGKKTEHLESILKTNGKTSNQSPAFDPAHDALILRELFTELLRTPTVLNEDAKYQELMHLSEELCKDLEKEFSHKKLTADQFKQAINSMTQLKQSCVTCHEAYR